LASQKNRRKNGLGFWREKNRRPPALRGWFEEIRKSTYAKASVDEESSLKL
jgi:hypothetical protein